MTDFQIGFLIYPGVVQLDVLGPYQVLSFPPNVTVHLIAKTMEPIVSNEGLILTPSLDFRNCLPLDVVCVPGGGMGQLEIMQDEETIAFLKRYSKTAQFVTSVCTGSLILAAAGLLTGYNATCHWAFRDQLALFGIEVTSERVVIDRNRITGAGVTSGLDFGLTLLAKLCGEDVAKMAQLMMEYDPLPPFDAGTPEKAGERIVEPFLMAGRSLIDAFREKTLECQKTQ
jgi:cyclohexyl-isocyanide hydratase